MSRRLFVAAALALPLLAWGQKVPPYFPVKEFLAQGNLVELFQEMKPGVKSEFGEHQLIGKDVDAIAVMQLFGPKPNTVSRGTMMFFMTDELLKSKFQTHLLMSVMFVVSFGVSIEQVGDWLKPAFNRTRGKAMKAKDDRAEEATMMGGYKITLTHNVSKALPLYMINVEPSSVGH